jgi:diguanylate cyclase (GGDEF)-like protein
MVGHLKRWLAPPHFPGNEAKSAQARTLNTLGLFFVLSLVLIVGVYIPFFVQQKALLLLVTGALFLTYAVARFLLFRGYITFSGTFILALGWGVSQILIFIGGGIYSPVMMILIVISITAGLILSPPIGYVFLAATLLSALFFGFAQELGVHLPVWFIHSPLATWFLFSLSLLFISIAVRLTVRRLEGVLAQRKQTELSLLRRNREMALLYQTFLEISALSDHSAVLNLIVQRACALLAIPYGSLYLLNAAENSLEMAVCHNLPLHWIGKKIKVGDGIAGQVALSRQPMIVEDYQAWAGRLEAFPDTPARRTLGVPLLIHENVIGVLILIDDNTGEFDENEVRLVSLFAAQAAITIENARLYQQVQNLAITDGLTGLYNRLFFDAELARMQTSRLFPISIIVGDIDNMKETNDTQGHPVGDELLKQMAVLFRQVFRSSDIIARTGGDEFAVLLPNTNAHTAGLMLKRIRDSLEQHNLTHPGLPIHLSLGSSTVERGSLSEAMSRADRDMYADKARRKPVYP